MSIARHSLTWMLDLRTSQPVMRVRCTRCGESVAILMPWLISPGIVWRIEGEFDRRANVTHPDQGPKRHVLDCSWI